MEGHGYGAVESAETVLGEVGAVGRRPDRGWDYVLSFDAPGLGGEEAAGLARADAARAKVLARLRRAGFAYELLWDASAARVLVCLGLPDDELMRVAEACGMELELKPRYGGGWLAFEVGRAHVFVNEGRVRRGLGYFYRSDVVMLTIAALASRESWGAGIDVERLVHLKVMRQAYPVHDDEVRESLLQAAVMRPWFARLRERTLLRLKRYLGAGVTLYVAFLGFYARMLTGIAAASVPVTALINYAPSEAVVAWARCAFGLVVVFWATYFLEYWKRRAAVLRAKWGLADMGDEAGYEVRPQFAGVVKKGFYCGGGFVDLADLDRQGAGVVRMGAAGGPSSPGRLVATTGDGFLDTTVAELEPVLAEGGGEEEGAAEEDAAGESGMAEVSEAEYDDVEEPPRVVRRDELRHAVSGSVVIGGTKDEMFKVEAVATGVKLDNLPSFPMCPKKELRRRVVVGAGVTAFFTLVVGLLTFLQLYYKAELVAYLLTTRLASFAEIAPGVITGVFISTCDGVWRKATVSLTNWENHRTQQAYENHQITKRFAFQFVSNFSSLFYIAFVKPHTPADACTLGASGAPDCMMELQAQLIGMVVTKATLMQAMEVGVPYVMGRINMWQQRRARHATTDELDAAEVSRLVESGAVLGGAPNKYLRESRLNPHYSPMDDYGELVISYGYFVLFGLAWPLAALVQAGDVALETRSDLFKILAVSQMPNSRDAADIGMWLPIMEFLRTMSVVTNAALIVFTGGSLSAMLPDALEPSPVLAFLILEHVLLLIKNLIQKMVNEVPGRTRRLVARQEYLISRWFNVGGRPCFKGSNADI